MSNIAALQAAVRAAQTRLGFNLGVPVKQGKIQIVRADEVRVGKRTKIVITPLTEYMEFHQVIPFLNDMGVESWPA